MYALKTQDQGLITLSQQDYLPIRILSIAAYPTSG